MSFRSDINLLNHIEHNFQTLEYPTTAESSIFNSATESVSSFSEIESDPEFIKLPKTNLIKARRKASFSELLVKKFEKLDITLSSSEYCSELECLDSSQNSQEKNLEKLASKNPKKRKFEEMERRRSARIQNQLESSEDGQKMSKTVKSLLESTSSVSDHEEMEIESTEQKVTKNPKNSVTAEVKTDGKSDKTKDNNHDTTIKNLKRKYQEKESGILVDENPTYQPVSSDENPVTRKIKELKKIFENSEDAEKFKKLKKSASAAKTKQIQMIDLPETAGTKNANSAAASQKPKKLSKNNCQFSDAMEAVDLKLGKNSVLNDQPIKTVICNRETEKKLEHNSILNSRVGQFFDQVEDQELSDEYQPPKAKKSKKSSSKAKEKEVNAEAPTIAPVLPVVSKENTIVDASNIEKFPELNKYYQQRYRYLRGG